MNPVGPPRDPSQGSFNVGGPTGITIQNNHGGYPQAQNAGYPQAPNAGYPQMGAPYGSLARVDASQATALAARHPRATAGLVAFGGVFLLTASIVFIELLQLPWIIVILPSLLAAAAMVAAIAIASRARSVTVTPASIQRLSSDSSPTR